MPDLQLVCDKAGISSTTPLFAASALGRADRPAFLKPCLITTGHENGSRSEASVLVPVEPGDTGDKYLHSVFLCQTLYHQP